MKTYTGLTVLAAVVSLAACGGDSATAPVVSLSYTLVAVDGQPLPYHEDVPDTASGSGSLVPTDVVAGKLSVANEESGVWVALTTALRTTVDGRAQVDTVTTAFQSAHVTGDSLYTNFGKGTMHGDTIVLGAVSDAEPPLFTYVRVP